MAPADDVGLFGPDAVTWRVHAEPILALAGLRALFLQALHPRVMAGVDQNSGYRSDPWGRLIRTINYVATVVYGTTTQAEKAGRRVRAIHAGMTAVDPHTGDRFRVDEPDLLLWVHVSEVESFISTATRAGLRLCPEEVDLYYAEQRRAARVIGLDPAGVPGSAADVAEYYRGVRSGLGMTRAAAENILFLANPPMPWGLGYTPVRLLWGGVVAAAIGLLPRWARRLYGMPGLPTTDLGVSASVRALRMVLAAVPHRMYEGPIYQSAMARAAAALPPSMGRASESVG
ncbi:MAG TPA: oxygenase MpaB family protein [Micromonosporaceae bacterium]|nr:oxygenase MpaB family protein [Micromonosporaceae bacterium]